MRSIFLDLNHWIALARAVYGKTVRPDHNTACERLREAVASKRIFLPLQISHLVEYSRDNSISRRQRMAAVFEEFTQNYFFAAWSTVLPYEFSRAISITFDLPNISADPVIFGKGPLFSLTEKAKELIRQDPDIHLGLDFHESLSGLPGMLYDLLTFPNETGRRNFSSIDEAIRAQAAIYTFHHQRELQVCLQLYGKSFADFITLGPVGMSKFFDHVPSLNVDRSLTIARDRHWDRAVQGNDLQDIGYLALAVPYCDAVLVENLWGHLLRTHKMDSKYGTVVLTDLADVIEFLDHC